MSNRIPNDWAEKELGEIVCQIIDFRGRTPKKLDSDWGGGDIRALSANNVQMGKIDFSKECYFASDELYKKWMTKGDTAKDDIVFTMEAPLGNVALVPDHRKYILSQRVVLLKTDSSIVNNRFLFHQLRGDSFQRQLRENATGSTALGIQQKRLVTLNTVLPPIVEQQKIASILTAVDEVIESTQAQINKLKELKTGMMQELLTKGIGHTEFKDSPIGKIPKAWEIKKLEDVVISKGLQTGPFGSQLHSHEYVERGIPVVMPKDLKNQSIDTSTIAKISLEKSFELERHKLKVGDILFSRRGDIGRCAIVKKENEGWICGTGCLKVRLNKTVVPEFLISYLSLTSVVECLNNNAVGQTMLNLNTSILAEAPVILPTLSEQKKIANSMITLVLATETKEKRLGQLTKLKSALMQDLLTGKVRV